MNLLKKAKLATAILAAFAAGNANAALTVSDSTNGNGSLFLTAFDNTLGVGYIRDLGTTLEGFLTSISWNPRTGDNTSKYGVLFTNAGDQLFQTTFQNSQAANINWNISAHDASNTDGGATGGAAGTPHQQRFLSTEQVGRALTGNAINVVNNQINNITSSKQTLFVTQANSACGFEGASCATDSSETSQGYYPGRSTSWGDDFGTALAGLDNTQTLGNALEFFYFTNSTGSGTSQSSKFAVGNELGRAKWMLSANGGLTLTAPIPVPAAVWMLGSALAALGGISRRRVAA